MWGEFLDLSSLVVCPILKMQENVRWNKEFPKYFISKNHSLCCQNCCQRCTLSSVTKLGCFIEISAPWGLNGMYGMYCCSFCTNSGRWKNFAANLEINQKYRGKIVQLGPKLQSAAKVLAQRPYPLSYPTQPPTHPPIENVLKGQGIVGGKYLANWLHISSHRSSNLKERFGS